MANSPVCDQCKRVNKPIARFCAGCGKSLDQRHEESAAKDEKWQRCDNAADLKYRLGSAWGGRRLLGTENLAITLVNHGQALRDLRVELRGVDGNRRQLFAVQQEIEQLDSGQEATFELPSYEISDETRDVTLSLISATRI